MTISRRIFVARTAAAAAQSGVERFAEKPADAASSLTKSPGAIDFVPMTLHGYGTLSANFHRLDEGRSSLLRILCETTQKALLTQAKYLSDLERLPGMTTARLTVHNRSLPCFRSAIGGVVTGYALGREVLIMAAGDEQAFAKLCGATIPRSAVAAEFGARGPIPMYLDRWDRYGLLCYFGPDAIRPDVPGEERNFDYAEGLEFLRDHGPLGAVLWTNPLAPNGS